MRYGTAETKGERNPGAARGTNCFSGTATCVTNRGKFAPGRDWEHLQRQAAAAQLSFLGTEVETGITFARIARTARDRRKISGNLTSARQADQTVTACLAHLRPEMPGLEAIRNRVATLQEMLYSLENQR